jgi:threonine efflux protein
MNAGLARGRHFHVCRQPTHKLIVQQAESILRLFPRWPIQRAGQPLRERSFPMSALHPLLLVYATYFIAAASPGPSNLAIMGVAMGQGRVQALALAMGVVTGAMFWAILAATGLSAVLATYASALLVIKVAGGIYLLYLAFKSARSALTPTQPRVAVPVAAASGPSSATLFRRGVFLHLSNPKAVLVWIAVMSLGLHVSASIWSVAMILAGCAIIGVTVFGGYALVFSTPPMVLAYRKARRGIEGVLAVFFGVAGFKLLTARI